MTYISMFVLGVIGLMVYVLSPNAKVAEMGRILYLVALFCLLFRYPIR